MAYFISRLNIAILMYVTLLAVTHTLDARARLSKRETEAATFNAQLARAETRCVEASTGTALPVQHAERHCRSASREPYRTRDYRYYAAWRFAPLCFGLFGQAVRTAGRGNSSY